LRYRAPGYELALAPNELDAAEFAQLVAEARQQAAAGDHGRALSLLNAALFLWGRTLADAVLASWGASPDGVAGAGSRQDDGAGEDGGVLVMAGGDAASS
jgi:hypothetical protein